MVDDCIDLVGLDAQTRHVTLAVEAPDGIAVFADDLALRQILLNLLSNAIAFTPEGGDVTVKVSTGAEGGVVVEVADTGIGMDEDGIRIALEPFGQVRKSTRPGERGTGLGLPIALRLAELHGGRLAIASTPGKGTTVRVSFPVAA